MNQNNNQTQQNNQRFKKDKIFIFVLSIVTAGLAFQTILGLLNIVLNGYYTNLYLWIYIFCDALAIYAVLYLLNNYKKRQKRNNE